VAALADRARLFVFVSSGNVYADHSFPGQDETGELVAALDRDVMESMESYGPAKVACEQLVRQPKHADV
jgi:nucleoside-diphosphate-sugar epimerase